MGRRAKQVITSEDDERRSPPAMSLEARENQLILLATNRAEEQLRNGTASTQVIVHYLRLGTTRERLEQEKLRQENELARAKTENIKSAQHSEELYQQALDAFRSYGGYEDEEDDYED